MQTPTVAQRVRYNLGGVLPETLQDWVRRDLLGRGAAVRYLLRFLVPMMPPLLLFLLFPGPVWVSVLMMLLIFLPVVYFAIGFTYVYRRFRLQQHNLDYRLADRNRNGADEERHRYHEEFGHE
ncbi:DUF5313 family protein [Williamsia sp.]|uniref:DUF5313 family protein n=1 Tax=Williamsia sp. TaxID=1872085 RepID=UPI002F91EC2A